MSIKSTVFGVWRFGLGPFGDIVDMITGKGLAPAIMQKSGELRQKLAPPKPPQKPKAPSYAPIITVLVIGVAAFFLVRKLK